MTPEKEIFDALSTDTAILEVVSGDTTKITNEHPDLDLFDNENIKESFPRITFVLADRRHSFHVDNTPVIDELHYDVDIWLPTSLLVNFTLNAIRTEVDRIMVQELGYSKVASNEREPIRNKISNMSITYSKHFETNS